jgi:hypothetical protein
MKLRLLAPLALVTAAASMTIGCGPGLSHRAKAPTDVFGRMDAELAHSIGTTSLTSETIPLPEGRLPLQSAAATLSSEDPWSEPTIAPAALTWGTWQSARSGSRSAPAETHP